MAPRKKSSSSSSPIPVGNCQVTVQANNFTCKSDPSSLQISLSKTASINISVAEEMNGKNSNEIGNSKCQEKEEGEKVSFLLLNPKDSDSCTKSYLQEVLKLYMKELPAMNYAANTGKQSMFLERCVTNGKYCTLLLKSNSLGDFGEVIAAITYQIVPADTHHAEIPLAAVSSIYQHKGFGCLLYLELRRRLHNVGIRTIICWGDKESEGFWFKQGFVSIAEVDKKGRARRLPIKAEIRRALCFPGGSTFMVSHLNKDLPDNSAGSLRLCLPLKPHEKSSSSAVIGVQQYGVSSEGCITPVKLYRISSGTENIPPEVLVNDGLSHEDDKLDGADGNKMAVGEELSKIGAEHNAKHCSCSTKGAKKRVWEASLSSLKSKKIKGSHSIDCQLDSNFGIALESDGNLSCFDRYSLDTSRNKSLLGVTPQASLSCSCLEKSAEEHRSVNVMPEGPASKELQSNGECFRILLMNIADDAKKTCLTKVIEDLGGAVISDGSLSTHVVTGKLRKTLNFCNALCSGAWILSPNWLKESFREGKFVDELPYILNDEEYVLKYRTELKCAVLKAKASPRALLKGYYVCIAAHVQPPAKTLSAIVRSAGGDVSLKKLTEF
uniref:BRCT domain-containing protein n=1 Tax=Fagus sylvatica TaxID=28930 RepID=A0A2N9IL67_FAGSY